MDEFDIYIRCFAGPGGATAESGLQRVFGLDERRSRELVQSLPRVVKRQVPGAHLAQYERVLQELGAEYELRRSAIRPQPIIAVAGARGQGGAFELEQHGSTLTLTLAPPVVPAPLPMIDASVRGVVGSQFAKTIVDDRPPYGLIQEVAGREQSQPAPPAIEPLVPAPPSQHAARDLATAPSHDTLQDGTSASIAPSRHAPAFEPVTPRPSAWPPRPDLPRSRSTHSAALVYDPMPSGPAYGADAWASLDSVKATALPATPAGVISAMQPRVISDAPKTGASPSSWQAPGLELDGRPGWFVDGRHVHQQADMLPEALGSAPASTGGLPSSSPASLRPPPAWQAPFAASAGVDCAKVPHSVHADSGDALALDERVESQPKSPRNQARAPRAGGASVAPARLGAPSRLATSVGLQIGRGLRTEDDDAPAMVRLLLRAGLGISLFVILTTVRQCRVVDSDIEDAMAEWGEQPTEPLAAGVQQGAPLAGGYGPPALQWMESELHQFSSGDKDRARSVARRYKKAGAVEVYVGSIMQSGPLHFAGELIVELPRDPDARGAVLAEHQRVLEASFGGFAPKASDPGGPVLRVTL